MLDYGRMRGCHPELCEGVGVVGQAQGVEGASGVQRVSHISGRAAIDTVALGQAQENDL